MVFSSSSGDKAWRGYLILEILWLLASIINVWTAWVTYTKNIQHNNMNNTSSGTGARWKAVSVYQDINAGLIDNG